MAGKLTSNQELVDDTGNKIGRVKKIQSENQSVQEAIKEQEVAISIPGSNFERKIKSEKYLYSNLSESQFKNFKKNKDLLSAEELKILQEIADIKKFI